MREISLKKSGIMDGGQNSNKWLKFEVEEGVVEEEEVEKEVVEEEEVEEEEEEEAAMA